MSNTDRDAMLERWAIGMEKLEQYYEGLYGPPATPATLPAVTDRNGMLEAIADGMERAKRNINKKSPTYHNTDSAYVKTVPSGDVHYASLEQIGGKTIVWNQLVDSGTTTVPSISGHTYYTLIDGTASIVTADGTAITIVDDTADMVCDLTLMFGSGNEPSTTTEFTAIYPATHYPYNAGTLLSAGVTEVESEGQNLINPANFTTNGVSFADGVITVDVSSGKNYRDIYAGTFYVGTAVPVAYIPKLPFLMPGTYTVANDGLVGASQRIVAHAVSDDGAVTQLGSSTASSFVITITQPTRVTLRVRSTGTVTNLRLTKTESAVPYKPYFSETYPIPAEIRALEGYGWSSGSVYNYIDFERKVFVQRVGSVDMSDLTFGYGPSVGWSATLPNVKNPADDDTAFNGLSATLKVTDRNTQATAFSGGTDAGMVSVAGGKVYVGTGSISIVPSGTLIYELDEPLETDISAYLTDDNLISVESGGTLTFPNANGDDYCIPLPSTEIFWVGEP